MVRAATGCCRLVTTYAHLSESRKTDRLNAFYTSFRLFGCSLISVLRMHLPIYRYSLRPGITHVLTVCFILISVSLGCWSIISLAVRPRLPIIHNMIWSDRGGCVIRYIKAYRDTFYSPKMEEKSMPSPSNCVVLPSVDRPVYIRGNSARNATSIHLIRGQSNHMHSSPICEQMIRYKSQLPLISAVTIHDSSPQTLTV